MPEIETERRKEPLEGTRGLSRQRAGYSAHLPFCQSPDEQGGAASCRGITEPRQSTGEAIVDLLGRIHTGDLLRRIYKFVEYLYLHH